MCSKTHSFHRNVVAMLTTIRPYKVVNVCVFITLYIIRDKNFQKNLKTPGLRKIKKFEMSKC